MDRYIGTRLEGRYDVLELIGRGGMANVYRAHDTIADRTVAVKILRDEYMNNADFLRRFKNESKAIALLNHPNIVRVYDVSFSDIHCIVMEYIDGVTLKEYIEHTGALPWKDAVHFTTQILHALQHAHDKGIVHRDIKPQNIMLLRSGEIKVTDFGIARFARSESRTITDRAIGSVHYISPEQAMGENTDDKSDIYSTGIVLFEMLTGELPFQADSAVSVAMKQIQTQIKNPRSINPSIPIGLEEITLRAVQKDPRYRFQSAAEMISALENIRENPEATFGYIFASDTQEIKRQAAIERKNNKPSKTRVKNKNTEKRKKSKSKTPYLKILMVVTLAIALGSAGFVGIMVWLNKPFLTTDEAILPNFVGQSISDIRNLYPDYTYEEMGVEHNDSFNKGAIFEQKPRAGASVKVGSSVKIWVSEGKLAITIPTDLIDMPATRAMHLLRELGLEPLQERMNHEDVATGRVIKSSPEPGEILSGGAKVIIYVSEGPEIIRLSVPDLIGISIDSARGQLENLDFTFGNVVSQASDLPKGTIISHFPAPGSFEIQGTAINFTISEGGLTRYSIPIPLPNIDREITIRARIGDEDVPPVAASEVLNPADSPTGVWSPTFAGEEGQELKVSIFIDKTLYQEYYLDFTDGSHWITRDRSSAAEFQQ